MSISEHLIDLSNKVAALDDKINLVDGTVQFNITLYWTVIIGIFAIIGIALYFVAERMVEKGIDKGFKEISEDIKSKIDRKDPEMIGTVKLTNSDNDEVNVRLVKFKNEPVINVETDKNDAVFKVNHREVIVEESYILTGVTMNGCFGEAKYRVMKYGKHKLIELILQNLKFSIGVKHDFMRLPVGHKPVCTVTFCGSDERGSVYNFSINPEGKVSIINPNKEENISAYIVFMANDENDDK